MVLVAFHLSCVYFNETRALFLSNCCKMSCSIFLLWQFLYFYPSDGTTRPSPKSSVVLLCRCLFISIIALTAKNLWFTFARGNEWCTFFFFFGCLQRHRITFTNHECTGTLYKKKIFFQLLCACFFSFCPSTFTCEKWDANQNEQTENCTHMFSFSLFVPSSSNNSTSDILYFVSQRLTCAYCVCVWEGHLRAQKKKNNSHNLMLLQVATVKKFSAAYTLDQSCLLNIIIAFAMDRIMAHVYQTTKVTTKQNPIIDTNKKKVFLFDYNMTSRKKNTHCKMMKCKH